MLPDVVSLRDAIVCALALADAQKQFAVAALLSEALDLVDRLGPVV